MVSTGVHSTLKSSLIPSSFVQGNNTWHLASVNHKLFHTSSQETQSCTHVWDTSCTRVRLQAVNMKKLTLDTTCLKWALILLQKNGSILWPLLCATSKVEIHFKSKRAGGTCKHISTLLCLILFCNKWKKNTYSCFFPLFFLTRGKCALYFISMSIVSRRTKSGAVKIPNKPSTMICL